MSIWEHCVGLAWDGCREVPTVWVYTLDPRVAADHTFVWRPLCQPCREVCQDVAAEVSGGPAATGNPQG